jgi:hypothetical protein
MKQSNVMLLCFLFVILLASCNRDRNEQIPASAVKNTNTASGKEVKDNLPVITFDKELHDFGKIVQGEKVSYSFKFTNTGKTDLVISNVTTSCGCTVPEYPKTPIRPGQVGHIKVTFDSSGRSGIQLKTITVLANTQPNTTVIQIKSEIVVPGK